ncbi:MAG: hypothetical protein FJ276_20885, partial [Planctomycetes bacterium]|nr:hypothetical protein [Planctomycetota bacterium]
MPNPGGTGGTDGEGPDAGNPPPGGVPGQPVEVRFDLDVLRWQVPDELEQDPGVFVALNDDYDEGNLGTEAIVVGPSGREVTVLKRVPDNAFDRIPEQQRRHRIRVGWRGWWNGGASDSWVGWHDDEVRPAVVSATVAGSVSFQVPERVRLWVPAAALYGTAAFRDVAPYWEMGTRWVEVVDGKDYLLECRPAGMTSWSGLDANAYAFPVAIEGLERGTAQIVATFRADAPGSVTLRDTVSVQVVSVDLDVDSDNNDGAGLPERSLAEDLREDAWRDPGKRLVVNADDADCDNIPDFLDGFDLDGRVGPPDQARPDDDTVAPSDAIGFTPVVVLLPAPIDPAKALIRFHYSGSDPARATIAVDQSRRPAPGGLRLWTVDEGQRRIATAANDPLHPGHYVAPAWVPWDGFSILDGGASLGDASQAHTVAQLTGGHVASSFVLYLEGIVAGQYSVAISVDPDGICQDPAAPVSESSAAGTCVDLFQGFVLHDVVNVTVESIVTVSAINAIGAETSSLDGPDPAAFQVSRGVDDRGGPLEVFYRVIDEGASRAAATDPVIDPARGDYRVLTSDGASGGLVGDAWTRVGSVVIPAGDSSTVITILPEDDAVVEWDEWITIELIDWTEYRRLHDQNTTPTPNDGLPAGSFVSPYWERRSPYRLRTDEDGNFAQHRASVMLLDNDHYGGTALVSNGNQGKTTVACPSLTRATIPNGLLDVTLYDGHATVVLPWWGASYRENDNLHPIAEAVLRLPEEEARITGMSAVYTLGGVSGERHEFDVADLASYLAPNPAREVRLVVLGADSLAAGLPTGHHDDDLAITVDLGSRTVTRTIRGGRQVVNLVDDAVGTTEFGRRWWVDELDRLVPSDGVTSRGGPEASSRLVPIGAAAQSGMALVRGDNSSAWFAARDAASKHLAEIDAAEHAGPAVAGHGTVEFSDPWDWIGRTGHGDGSTRSTVLGLAAEETSVTWRFDQLEAGRAYQVFVHWDADAANATNAAYQVLSANPVSANPVAVAPGSAEDAATVLVDQRYVPGEYFDEGRRWRSLGFFTPQPGVGTEGGAIQVRLSTLAATTGDGGEGAGDARTVWADGRLSAGAVMLVGQWSYTTPPGSFSTLELNDDGTTVQLATKNRDTFTFSAADGLLQNHEDRNGNRTEYVYVDADGDARCDELSTITRQGDLRTRFHYTGPYVTAVTDFAGRRTQWHNVAGDVLRVSLPEPGYDQDQPVFEFAYRDGDGLVTRLIDPRGYETSIGRDGRTSRVTSVANPAGGNPAGGNPAGGNPAGGGWTLSPYLTDGLDGALRAAATGGIGSRATGGALSEPRSTYVDARGNAWTYQMDAFGLLTAEAKPPVFGSPHADVWLWTRDVHGMPVQEVVPPGGGGDLPLPALIVTNEYDGRGNLVRRASLDAAGELVDSEQWTYDPVFSRAVTHQDPLNRTTTHVLDGRGNVVSTREGERKYADTPDRVTRFSYTPAPPDIAALPGGLVTLAVVAFGTPDAVATATDYFAEGAKAGLVRAERKAVGVEDSDIATTVQYDYDACRNLALVTDAMGRVTEYVHDRLDRLHQRRDPEPGTGDHAAPVTSFRYDASGNLSQVLDPRGSLTVHEYGPTNRLV